MRLGAREAVGVGAAEVMAMEEGERYGVCSFCGIERVREEVWKRLGVECC